MSVYVIGHARITDKDAFASYAKLGFEATEAAGGKFIAVGDGDYTVIEGEQFAEGGIVVIKFPSLAQYKAFYNGDDYQKAIKMRENACTMDVVVLEGLDV